MERNKCGGKEQEGKQGEDMTIVIKKQREIWWGIAFGIIKEFRPGLRKGGERGCG